MVQQLNSHIFGAQVPSVPSQATKARCFSSFDKGRLTHDCRTNSTAASMPVTSDGNQWGNPLTIEKSSPTKIVMGFMMFGLIEMIYQS